jgi:hypothetical protein
MPKAQSTLDERAERLARLLSWVKPLPAEWAAAGKANGHSSGARELTPLECRSWRELSAAWERSMRWTGDMDAALACMLAVAVSTEQQGDQQLFLQVVANAGSAKTRLCDAMLVSKHCKALEHLTGFHSGYDDGSGEDFSLLARINKKTLITPEGDVLMSNPRFGELMSQQRRIFDGTSQASYKNKKEEQRHEGLRTPWIIAGTPALLNLNQASLGDRFLRVLINPPPLDVRREILRKVGLSALRTVTQRSNCDPSSIIEDKMLECYRRTGGYVDFLRERAGELLSDVRVDEDAVVGRMAVLAEFVADMRARPDANAVRLRLGERHDAKELPTRLTFQFCRLARCLAAVLQRGEIDAEVVRRVRKVALDTAHGHVLSMTRRLWAAWQEKEEGVCSHGLAAWVGEGEEKVGALLKFTRKMDVTCLTKDNHPRWRLTDRLLELCREVL